MKSAIFILTKNPTLHMMQSLGLQAGRHLYVCNRYYWNYSLYYSVGDLL